MRGSVHEPASEQRREAAERWPLRERNGAGCELWGGEARERTRMCACPVRVATLLRDVGERGGVQTEAERSALRDVDADAGPARFPCSVTTHRCARGGCYDPTGRRRRPRPPAAELYVCRVVVSCATHITEPASAVLAACSRHRTQSVDVYAHRVS